MPEQEPSPLPLALRIDLAEAFIELCWERYKQIPDGRGFDTQREAECAREVEMSGIDLMLDKLLAMYDERALEEVA